MRRRMRALIARNPYPTRGTLAVVLNKKQSGELETLIASMSPDQFKALHIDMCDKLYQEMDLEELKAARDKLNGLIEAAQDAERNKFLEQAKAFFEQAKQLNIDLGSELGIAPPAKRGRPANGAANGAAATPVDGRSSAPPKYRDPLTGKTWSGRGQQAGFITEAIDSGRIKSKEDFLIR